MPGRVGAIDIGSELTSTLRNGVSSQEPIPGQLVLLELSMLCFIEGVDPSLLPLSQAQDVIIRRELSLLSQMNTLEAFMLCSERIAELGSFRGYIAGDQGKYAS